MSSIITSDAASSPEVDKSIAYTNGSSPKKKPVRKPALKQRDNALESLLDSKERLRMAIESTDLGAWEYYPETQEMIWSSECRKIYGLPDHIPASSTAFKQIIHPDDWDFVAKEIGKPLPETGDADYSIRFRIIRDDDKSVRLIKAQWKVYFNGERKPQKYIGIVLDITDTKNREQQLQEMQEKLRVDEDQRQLLFNSLPFAMYATDAQGKVTHYNQAAIALWGQEPTIGTDFWCGSWKIYEANGKSMPHDRSPMAVALKERREVKGTEIVIERPDGSRRYVLPNPQPIFDAQGNLTGAVNTLIDITERKKAEESIRESEANLHALFDNTKEGFILLDLSSKILAYNNAASALYQKMYSKNLQAGKTVTEVLGQELGGYVLAAFEKVRAGESLERKSKQRAADGKEYWLRGNYNPVLYQEEKIIGICMGLSDITAEVEDRTVELLLKNKVINQQKDFVETVLDSSVDQICVYDKEMRFLAVNKRFSEMSGVIAEQILGKTFAEVFPAFANSIIYHSLARALKGILTEDLAWESPGTNRFYSMSFIPLTQGTEVYGAIVAAHNNTELLQTTEQLQQFNQTLEEKNLHLRESEERYQKMIEEVEDYAIIMLDIDGIIQNWNIGVQKIKGYSASEIIGQHYRIFYFEEDLENQMPEQNLEKAARTGRVEAEGWRKRKDGSRFWGSTVLTALHDESNAVIGFIKLTKDHTARKNAEDKILQTTKELQEINKELKQQKEFVESVIDSSVDLITVYDIQTRVLSVNTQVEKLLGLNRDELIGKKFKEIFPDKKASFTYNNLLRALSGENVHYVHPMGQMGHSFDVFMVPLKHAGRIYAALVLTHDITEIIEISDKLHIANSALEEKNRDLERSNKELEQFAYVASHDLQEPLRKIRMFSGRIQESPETLNEPTRAYLDKIVKASDRMSDLIKDVLQFSRLSNSKPSFEKTNLNKILKTVLADLELTIDEKKAVITSNTLPAIDGIPQQLNQLFYNLISNSMKFSHGGEPPQLDIHAITLGQEEIREKNLDEKNTYYKITFKDNGIGFDQMFAEKIFIIFQRLNDRTKFEGTGIGLALCRKIVTIHGGEIYATSKVGKGAEFIIILPKKH